MKVHLECELIKIAKSAVTIEIRWIDENEKIKKQQAYHLMEGDAITWKELTRELDD